MKVISEKVLEKLESQIEKDKPTFLVFCYDVPSEFIKNISKEEKGMLLLKRINFKNNLDKWSIFVNNSVYLINYHNLQNLINDFEENYEDIAEKYRVDLKLLGLAFDLELVKDIIVDRIKTIQKETKNFFEYILDTEKVTEEELAKIKRTYKTIVKKLGIAINYRCKDLAVIDNSLSLAMHDKLKLLSNSRYEVLRKIRTFEFNLAQFKPKR